MATESVSIPMNASIHEALSTLLARAEHIRLKKGAQVHKEQSKIDALTGATQKEQGVAQVFKIQVSLHNHNLNILMRDKGSRELASSEGENRELDQEQDWERFDWRSITVCSFPNKLHVTMVEGYIPGQGWVSVDLGGRRFWPQPPDREASIRTFVETKRRAAVLEGHKTRVQGRGTKLRKKLDKGTGYSYTDSTGQEWETFHEIGETDKLFEGDTEIKKVRTIHKDKVVVFGLPKVPSDLKAPDTMDEVLAHLVKGVTISEELKRLNEITRPVELGIIEDYARAKNIESMTQLNGVAIDFGGESFTVAVKDDDSYDYPAGTSERLEKGEIVSRTVPTRGQWKTKRKEKPTTTNEPAEETQDETVSA